MNVGKLTRKVMLMRCTETKDAAAEPIRSYANLAEVWASIEPLSVREQIQAQQSQTVYSTRIRIRYLEGLKATDRVLWDGRTFEISSIIDKLERHHEMELLCVEFT